MALTRSALVKRHKAIAALAQAVTTEATIIRNGEKLRVSSRELVPGDLVRMSLT